MNLEINLGPPPDLVWSQNKTLHWAQRSRLRRNWREFAANVDPEDTPLPLPRSFIEVTLPFSTNNRRDPHNYTGTVVKSMIDGFVDAGFWPDDTSEYVVVLDPVCVKGEDVTIKIWPVPDA